MSTTHHCCITLEGALENWKYMTTTVNGKKRRATLKEVKASVEEARSKGYTVLPPCDNVDERGRCKGHDSEVLQLNEKYEQLESKKESLQKKLDSVIDQLDVLVKNAVIDGYTLDSGKWVKITPEIVNFEDISTLDVFVNGSHKGREKDTLEDGNIVVRFDEGMTRECGDGELINVRK
jgi:hypothetical protein